MMIGSRFKKTWKTKVYLKLYEFFNWFNWIPQYFITHCDYEEDSVWTKPNQPIKREMMNQPKDYFNSKGINEALNRNKEAEKNVSRRT
jgi:hypothetical protein